MSLRRSFVKNHRRDQGKKSLSLSLCPFQNDVKYIYMFTYILYFFLICNIKFFVPWFLFLFGEEENSFIYTKEFLMYKSVT